MKRVAEAPPVPAPGWLKPAIVVLSAIFLIGIFATEFSDSDAFWHLKTGEYLVHFHKLPVPDPFAYTTYLGQAAYPGEDISDRPLPELVVPRLIELFESRRPSGRIRGADLAQPES